MDISRVPALLDELKTAVKEIFDFVDHVPDKDVHAQTKYQRTLARLCYSIEGILEQGRKETSVFSSTPLWNYLEQVTDCLPGTQAKETIKIIKEAQKGNLGRSRVFIRLTLNEHTLPEYLKALVWNAALTETYYRESAIIRNEEYFITMLSLLESLHSIPFNFIIKDKNLEDPEYWSKLIKKSSSSNSSYMTAPPNFVSLSQSFGDLETLNSLLESTESKDREIKESRNLILHLKEACDSLKEELDREKLEKSQLETKYATLDKDFQVLLQRLNDLGVELNVYKTHVNKVSSVENIISATTTTTATPQESAEVDTINSGSLLVEETDEEDIFLPTSEVFSKAHLCLEQLKSYDNLIQEKLNTIK